MELMELIKEISAVCVVLASIAGGIAVIVKILNHYSTHLLFKQKCEGYESQIAATNTRIEAAHNFAQESLLQMQTETDAKLQEIRAEQEMITMCMRAVLDGLHQLNCNGEVTKASQKLDDYLNARAHQ